MHLLTLDQPILLEGGSSLHGVDIAYHTYGQLSTNRDNVIWVCHALTANSDVADWWNGLFGEGRLLDQTRYFIVCANVLGGCYGSTGPLSIEPETGKPYFHDFPSLTIRDLVAAHEQLRNHLGIAQIHRLIGGSLGGQQALEWAIMHPDRIENLVMIATNARHSPWGIAFNEAQRMAISADSTWSESTPEAGLQGLKAARAVALLSYRHYEAYALSQSEPEDGIPGIHRAIRYQQYQGEKLARRFNAFSYWRLSEAMESHDISRGRGSIADALALVKANTQILGIQSDLLFPTEEQRILADGIREARLHLIPSSYGHDGFLVETERIGQVLCPAAHILSVP